ncbi:MAG: radical SAM protein [Kibdelosporangium sp.]
MTALLVNPPGLRPGRPGSFFADQKRNLAPDQYATMPMEHLGLMSIVAYARACAVDVACVNGMVSDHASIEETWQAMRAAVRGRPTLVGFSNIDSLHEVVELAGRVRVHWDGVPVVLGNAMATLNRERLLRDYDCIDFVVLGDGEQTFVDLANALADGKPVDGVPSLAWRDADGTMRANPPRLVDLDSLPPPSRDELPAVLGHGFSGAVYSTRGCPYRCTFCGTGAMSGLLGRDSYRSRSVESVVDEIARLARDFGLQHVSVIDDLFVSKHPVMQDRAALFATEMLRRGRGVEFMIDARLDSIGDLDLYAHLYRAGLRRVFVGIETGSYEQLVAYRKRSVRAGEDAAAKIVALQDLGIEVVPGTIMFHPRVRPAELRETTRMLSVVAYKSPRKFLDRITAYPGTPLHHDYAAAGLLTQEWPIGRWEFPDPLLSELYDDVVRRIDFNSEISFEEAAAFFLDRVSEWEAAASAWPDAVTTP